jgi:hypothetical protein
VFWLADAEHHPVRAVIVLYGAVIVIMVGGMAWASYRWKRRDWERVWLRWQIRKGERQ